MAGLQALRGIIERHRWGGGVVVDDVAVWLEAAASTSPPRVGPNVGNHRGTQWRRLRPCMMVVGGGGGGGERKGWDGHNV